MNDFIYSFIVGFLGAILGYLSGLFATWFVRRPPKIITKIDVISNYYNFQDFHLKEFKKAINNELKKYIKTGKKFPIYVNYEKVLSDNSLDLLRDYIKSSLKFEDFELEQKENWSVCQLILRG